MSYDIEEFLEEYDDFTEQVRSSSMSLFQSRLALWINLVKNDDPDIAAHFKWLMEREGKHYSFDAVFMKNSGAIDLPTNKLDRLSANINLFMKFNNGLLDPMVFSYVMTGERNANTALSRMLNVLFDPFTSEFRRYIRQNFDEPVPDAELEIITPEEVPASDRIVSLDHNQAYYVADEALANIEKKLLQNNEASPEDKERVIAEISAARRLMQASSIRVKALITLLSGALVWVMSQFAETAVGQAATWAIDKLIEYLPLLSGFI